MGFAVRRFSDRRINNQSFLLLLEQQSLFLPLSFSLFRACCQRWPVCPVIDTFLGVATALLLDRALPLLVGQLIRGARFNFSPLPSSVIYCYSCSIRASWAVHRCTSSARISRLLSSRLIRSLAIARIPLLAPAFRYSAFVMDRGAPRSLSIDRAERRIKKKKYTEPVLRVKWLRYVLYFTLILRRLRSSKLVTIFPRKWRNTCRIRSIQVCTERYIERKGCSLERSH